MPTAKKATVKKTTAKKAAAKRPAAKKATSQKTAAKKSRSGPNFFHGDDLTKTKEDRKRRSKTEPWEKKAKPKR
jgi:hypothetical protein